MDGPWTVESRYRHFKKYYEFEGGIYQDELKIPLEVFLELARDPYVTDEELYSHIKPVAGERMAIKGHPLTRNLTFEESALRGSQVDYKARHGFCELMKRENNPP